MSLNESDSDKYAARQMRLLETMTVHRDGKWFKGTIARYEFFALVFKTGSQYGINGGRVSKLTVRHKVTRFTDRPIYIINYDRGWDVQPEDDLGRLVLDTLIEYFENLPEEAIP